MGLLADLNVPISLADSSTSAIDDNTYIDFGDGGLFAPNSMTTSPSVAAAASEGGAALATTPAGTGTAAASTPLSTTTMILIALAIGALVWFNERKK